MKEVHTAGFSPVKSHVVKYALAPKDVPPMIKL